jgi:serine/threonine-protein kinase
MGADDHEATTRRIRGHRAGVPIAGGFEPGTQIGDYRILDVIAVGGFGTVYRVEHVVLGRTAALKVLHHDLGAAGDAARRFEREARAVNIIRHPNVVDIFDFGHLADGQPYFVMELLEGQDLQSRIDERGRLPLDEIVATLEPLCSALAAAHAHDIVHRDIKASNVFRHEQADRVRIVLLDFGVAKLLRPSSLDATTASHIALGTPACMAPEQVVGGEVTPRTDIYALGALAFHMVTGSLPFSDASITMMQQMHVHAKRPAPSDIVPTARVLDDVVARAMSRNPDDRHSTVGDFLDAVRDRARPRSVAPARPRLGRGIGVHVEVLVPQRDLEDPDDRLLDDLAWIGDAVHAALAPAGFERVMDAGTTALFVRALDDGAGEAAAIQTTAALMADVERSLAERPHFDPRVGVSVVIHADGVLASNGVVKGGDLLQLAAWVPVGRVPGILVI